MPRFKATPKRGHDTLQESDSQSDEDVSSDDMHVFSEDEGKTTREQVLHKLVSIAQQFVSKLVNINTHSVRNLDTAILLAQAAALAAFATEPNTPSFENSRPPIAPLGLSLESPRIPRERTDVCKKSALEMISTETQTVNQDTPDATFVMTTPGAKSTSVCAVQTMEFGPTDNIVEANERSNTVFGIIPLAGPEYDDPSSRRKTLDVTDCPICHKIMKRGSIREHMEMHNNSGKFKCDKCPKTFSRASAREKHFRTHTGERPFVCEYCSKAYRQRVHLNEHLRSHTGLRPFVCRLCGFSLASKSLLNRHLGTHGVKIQLPDAPDLWFRSDAPKETVLNLAAEAGRVLCAANVEAGNVIANGNSSHTSPTVKKRSKSPSTPISKNIVLSGRKYLCSACPAGFPTVQALRSHRLTTHGVQFPHKCPECEESFTSIKLRKAHLREQHPQVCPICSKIMPQRRFYFLHAHMREAHPECESANVMTRSSVRAPKPPKSGVKRSATTNEKDELRKWKHFKEGDPGSSSSGVDYESEFSSNHSSSSNESDSDSNAEPGVSGSVLAENLPTEISTDPQEVSEPHVVSDAVGVKETNDGKDITSTSEQSPLNADIRSYDVTLPDEVVKSTSMKDIVDADQQRSATDAAMELKCEMVSTKVEGP